MCLSPEELALLGNHTFSDSQLQKFCNERSHFIQYIPNPTTMDYIKSKGVFFDCYLSHMGGLNDVQILDNKIDVIRTIIYGIAKPLQSQFFYWTLLLLILHKFNFRKPVMKVILAHYVLRAIGDILDQLGGLMSTYYVKDAEGKCVISVSSVERHPLKWFLTRQIGNIFWYSGEIFGDWYPLLRTRAVARDQKSIWYVYITCGLFNISKVGLIILHYFRSPSSLYDKNGVFDEEKNDRFYNYYWIFQSVVILTSLIYDLTVFLVLKRQIFNKSNAEVGFLKKFRSISEYRIIVSAIIGVIGLPIILMTIAAKFFLIHSDAKYNKLNFSFEDIRILINSVQYYMIFIDQIMLFRSRDGSSLGDNTYINGPYSSNNNNFSSSNNNLSTKNNINYNNSFSFSNSISSIKKSNSAKNFDSSIYYNNLMSSPVLDSTQKSLLQYNYISSNNINNLVNNNNNNNNNNHNNNSMSFNSNDISNTTINVSRMKPSPNQVGGKNNTIANYDEYNGIGNEWTYLRK